MRHRVGSTLGTGAGRMFCNGWAELSRKKLGSWNGWCLFSYFKHMYLINLNYCSLLVWSPFLLVGFPGSFLNWNIWAERLNAPVEAGIAAIPWMFCTMLGKQGVLDSARHLGKEIVGWLVVGLLAIWAVWSRKNFLLNLSWTGCSIERLHL